MLKLSDKDFKEFIIKKLLQSIIYSLEIIEDNRIQQKQVKRNQMKIIELKNTTTEVNGLLNGLNRKVEMAEDISLRTD